MVRHRKGVGLNGSQKSPVQSQFLGSSSSVQTPRASIERQGRESVLLGLSRLRQPAHRGSALARSGHRLALGCRHPGVGVRAAFAAQDVVDMVRTNAGSRGC